VFDNVNDVGKSALVNTDRTRIGSQIFVVRKFVVGGINTHSLEHLCIFGEAIFLKTGLGYFPSVFITFWTIKLT